MWGKHQLALLKSKFEKSLEKSRGNICLIYDSPDLRQLRTKVEETLLVQ